MAKMKAKLELANGSVIEGEVQGGISTGSGWKKVWMFVETDGEPDMSLGCVVRRLQQFRAGKSVRWIYGKKEADEAMALLREDRAAFVFAFLDEVRKDG